MSKKLKWPHGNLAYTDVKCGIQCFCNEHVHHLESDGQSILINPWHFVSFF